MTEFITR